MPTFECATCHDCFTKKKAEAHMMGRCSKAMICVDCNVIFTPDTIKAHTNCITETEKYAGKWLAKQKEQPKEPKEPKAPFVPPLPYDLNDSDGDSDIAIPQQSPISGPKVAPIAPTVISLVYAEDAQRKQQERKAKVAALHEGRKETPKVTEVSNSVVQSKEEPEKKAKKSKKDKTKKEQEDVTANGSVEKEAPKVEVTAESNGTPEAVEVPVEGKKKKEKKAKEEKSDDIFEDTSAIVPQILPNAQDADSKSHNKKRKHKETQVEKEKTSAAVGDGEEGGKVEKKPKTKQLPANGCVEKEAPKEEVAVECNGTSNAVEVPVEGKSKKEKKAKKAKEMKTDAAVENTTSSAPPTVPEAHDADNTSHNKKRKHKETEVETKTSAAVGDREEGGKVVKKPKTKQLTDDVEPNGDAVPKAKKEKKSKVKVAA